MPNLIEKLKRVDLGNGCLSCDDARYLKKYVVCDVPRCVSDVKIVFLVESPHTEEICRGYPLAGSSGQSVTRNLIFDHHLQGKLDDKCRNTSIGKLVHKNIIPWLAIMNVSLLPLQKIAYHHTEARSTEIRTLWCAFKEIKWELEKHDEEDLCPISCNVYKAIVNDLACRIERITSQCQPMFIPFGNVARQSLDEAKRVRESLQGLSVSNVSVWHPSAWKYLKPQERVKHLEGVASDIEGYLKHAP